VRALLRDRARSFLAMTGAAPTSSNRHCINQLDRKELKLWRIRRFFLVHGAVRYDASTWRRWPNRSSATVRSTRARAVPTAARARAPTPPTTGRRSSLASTAVVVLGATSRCAVITAAAMHLKDKVVGLVYSPASCPTRADSVERLSKALSVARHCGPARSAAFAARRHREG